jgi:DNA polymerase III delta subunit
MKILKPLEFVSRLPRRLPVVFLYGNNLALQRFYLNCLRSSLQALTYTTIDSAKQLAIVAAPSLFEEENSGKLIFLASAGERDLAPLQSFIEKVSDAHVLVVASSLPIKSKLVSYFLTHKSHAALPCYDLKTQELKGFIAQAGAKGKMALTPEALLFLAESFLSCPDLLLSELEKLSLYQSSQGEPLSLKAAQALVSCHNQLNLDSLIQALMLGNVSLLLRSFSPAFIEDEFILIIRSLIRNYCQLFELLTHVQQNVPFVEALERLSVPVFFQLKPLFAQLVERCSLALCAQVLERLLLLEKAYKNQEVNWPEVQANLVAVAQKVYPTAILTNKP